MAYHLTNRLSYLVNWKLWQTHPALLYGLAYFLGLEFALCTPWALLPFIFLYLTAYSKGLVLTLVFLLPLPWLYWTPLANEGKLHIKEISHHYGWTYKGSLNGRPVVVHTKTYYPATRDYYVTGAWKTNQRFETTSWRPLKRPSLAQLRYSINQGLKKHLHKHFKHENAAEFIQGMLTGYTKTGELKKRFQALGLSHLLAVSGFHFAFIYFCFKKLLDLFFSRKQTLWLLLLLMSLYALIVGHYPSALRAWIFTTIYLAGQIMDKQPKALNTLGSAMLISLIFDPFSCMTLSFQLSFSATAGLILFYHPIERLLTKVIPQLNTYTVVSHHCTLWGLGYSLCCRLRSCLALSCAVHVTTVPLILYYFHLFYPHGLLYNLFFPFLASLSLLLLPLYPLCDFYTHCILQIAYHPPLLLPAWIMSVPLWEMAMCLTGLIGWGLYKEEQKLRAPITN